MMRIGIDLTALPDQPVGAGNYLRNLVSALAERPEDAELVIFAQPHARRWLHVQEGPQLRLVWTPELPPAVRLVWEQVAFPGLAARQRLDVLHSTHYTLPVAYRGKRVVTLHDMTFFLFPQLHTRSKRVLFPLFIRLSGRLADRLIAVSESTRQDSIRLAGVRPEKIVTVPLGVGAEFQPVRDPARLQDVRQRYNLPDKYAFFVGLVEPRKNVPALLHAFARFAPLHPEYCLVIAGRKGWMSDQVYTLADQLGIQERVSFLGYVPQEDLPTMISLAEFLVYPSSYEGFGLPVLEAMACGTPPITTRISAMPEIVGEAGLLTPPDDPQAISQAMHELASDPARRSQLAALGLQRAAGFTWARTAAQTLNVYRAVLEKEEL